MKRLQSFLRAWLCAVALVIGAVSLSGVACGEGERAHTGPIGALAALASAWMVRRRPCGAWSDSMGDRPI